jgi:hypothetical protein
MDTERKDAETKPLAMQGLRTLGRTRTPRLFLEMKMTFIQALKGGRVQYMAKAVSR